MVVAALVATSAVAQPQTEAYRTHLREGILNNNLGRYRAAEESFRKALDVCERRLGINNAACTDVLLRLAMEISNQERFEEAELMFSRAEPLLREADSLLDKPRYLTYRAMDLANRKNFKRALAHALEANRLRKELIKTEFAAAKTADEDAKRRLDRALTDLAHGLFVQSSIAFRLGRTAEAKVTAHLTRRLIIKAENAPDWWVAFVDELLADIDMREGNAEAAEKRLRLALKTKRYALGNTRAVALSHLALGSVYWDGRRDSEAVETIRPGLAIVRGELGQVPGIDLEQLLPFLMAAHAEARRKPERRARLFAEMFGASQLLRASGMAKTIAEATARFATRDPAIAARVRRSQEAARRRDRLRLELGRAAVSLSGPADPRRIGELREAYAAAADEAAALETELVKVFPEYARFVTAPPVPANELERLLRPDEAVIRFIIGDAGSFAFVARDETLTAYPLDIRRAELEAAVRHLRTPFEKAGRLIPAYDLAAAHALYRALFGPLEGDLVGVRHLVTVSSGALLSLPFALLVTKAPVGLSDNDYGKAAWLARKMVVSQVPSVRAFANLRGVVKASAAPLPFVGFGDPAFGGRPGGNGMVALARHCQVGAPVPPNLLRGLAALPETRTELQRVARALGADEDSVHLGAAASEGRLRELRLWRYRVVYFATHGLLPGALRCQSEPALALSPPAAPSADKGADGLLDASEIAGLKLDADLVVLSACNTGGGGTTEFGGESLSSLTSAFFQAGARAMIVSHWQVDSRATTRLMTALFERLGDGRVERSADALRAAQLDMIGDPETSHPFFWAAFTFVGAGPGGVSQLPTSDLGAARGQG